MKLSLSGLARVTGKSERTIARYLKNGPLSSLTRDEQGLYDVDEEMLLSLRPQDESTVILQHLAEISERLAAIEALLQEQPYKQIAARSHVIREPSRPAAVEQPALLNLPPDLPSGTLTLSEMARELGISRTTLLGHCKHLAHESRPLQSRPGEHARFFTPEQAEQARRWHAEHSKK